VSSTNRAINGRVATEYDFHYGGAVFFIRDTQSVPYSFGRPLPVTVRFVDAGADEGRPPVGTEVDVLQAELTDEGTVVLGYEHEGKDGICLLSEVEVVDSA
jgi:hypothetical protein